MSRLIVVSNRVAQTPRGKSVGGLASALAAALRDRDGIWFGWSGDIDTEPSTTVNVRRKRGITYATIDLTQDNFEAYYNGYANQTIWPLFHSGSVWSKYANPEFDKAVDAARQTLDEKLRLADYKTAFEILHRDVPGIGLYQADALYAARQQLQWTPTPNEAFFIMDMSWK